MLRVVVIVVVDVVVIVVVGDMTLFRVPVAHPSNVIITFIRTPTGALEDGSIRIGGENGLRLQVRSGSFMHHVRLCVSLHKVCPALACWSAMNVQPSAAAQGVSTWNRLIEQLTPP